MLHAHQMNISLYLRKVQILEVQILEGRDIYQRLKEKKIIILACKADNATFWSNFRQEFVGEKN